ncbi:MAG: PHA/PHB synthase family protein, partial [Burkholderiales bacterium]
MKNAFAQWLELIESTSRKLAKAPAEPHLDLSLPEIFRSLTASLQQDGETWLNLQTRYYDKQWQLWMQLMGANGESRPQPAQDRRFHSPEWKDLPYFDFLKQSYLLNSEFLGQAADNAALDAERKRKLKFFTRQFTDAMSPANFTAFNPEAIKFAVETQGESVVRGLKHALEDLEKGRISMTDESAFRVGGNLAITEGAVVYRNEFFELLQYSPATPQVFERPFLIIPPCINKYYILDLQPENSFVRFCVEQGHSVFLISWRNVPPEMGHANWDDYLTNGIMQGLKVTLAITRAKQINTLGFCVGGTLLACTLAALPAKERSKVASLTLLTSMLDFCDVGEIAAYVDRAYVEKLERDFAHGGLLPGRDLATAFASLRANELIWFYVVNNYLKGKTPLAFDLLYWNSDSANLPGPMYAYYVRNMYLENSLRCPNKLTMGGAAIDLGKLDMPAYVLATLEDHIVPWKSAYAS